MFAKLSALVGSSPAFPYAVGAQHTVAWGSWTHFDGTVKDSGVAVSIFKVTAESKTDPKLQAARNGVKRLKLVRSCSLGVSTPQYQEDHRFKLITVARCDTQTSWPSEMSTSWKKGERVASIL